MHILATAVTTEGQIISLSHDLVTDGARFIGLERHFRYILIATCDLILRPFSLLFQ